MSDYVGFIVGNKVRVCGPAGLPVGTLTVRKVEKKGDRIQLCLASGQDLRGAEYVQNNRKWKVCSVEPSNPKAFNGEWIVLVKAMGETDTQT